jgi:hypothetical protein
MAVAPLHATSVLKVARVSRATTWRQSEDTHVSKYGLFTGCAAPRPTATAAAPPRRAAHQGCRQPRRGPGPQGAMILALGPQPHLPRMPVATEPPIWQASRALPGRPLAARLAASWKQKRTSYPNHQAQNSMDADAVCGRGPGGALSFARRSSSSSHA